LSNADYEMHSIEESFNHTMLNISKTAQNLSTEIDRIKKTQYNFRETTHPYYLILKYNANS